MSTRTAVDTAWVRKREAGVGDLADVLEAMLKVRISHHTDGSLVLDASDVGDVHPHFPDGFRVYPDPEPGIWWALGPGTKGTIGEHVAGLVMSRLTPSESESDSSEEAA